MSGRKLTENRFCYPTGNYHRERDRKLLRFLISNRDDSRVPSLGETVIGIIELAYLDDRRNKEWSLCLGRKKERERGGAKSSSPLLAYACEVVSKIIN